MLPETCSWLPFMKYATRKNYFADDESGFLGIWDSDFCGGIKKCGISGTHMHVMINGEEEGVHVHEHVHTHTHDHTEAEHVHTNEHEAAEHHHDESSHAHTHHSYQSVLAQIEHLQLPAQVKADAAAIYRLIGEAESAIHNTTLEQIHFHEVGTLDALADVCGCALLMYLITPEKYSLPRFMSEVVL